MKINTEILTKEKTQKNLSQIIRIEEETSKELGVSYGKQEIFQQKLSDLA